MTPQQALDLAIEYNLWKKEAPLPEGSVLIMYSVIDGARISHRFRVVEGALTEAPKEVANA